jgi:hypothetical protein
MRYFLMVGLFCVELFFSIYFWKNGLINGLWWYMIGCLIINQLPWWLSEWKRNGIRK